MIRLEDDLWGYTCIGTCYTHAPNLDLGHGLELRANGRIISLHTIDAMFLFAIRDPLDSKCDDMSFVNEKTWISSQVAAVSGNQDGEEEKHTSGKPALSVYKQKEMLMSTEQGHAQVQVEPLKKKSSSKPSALIIADGLLSGFKAKRFTHHLDVQKISIGNMQEAVDSLTSMRLRYDCIILHIIGDDIRKTAITKCAEFMQGAIEAALKRAEALVLSLTPPKADNAELNQKAMELNSIIHNTYGSMRNVVICDNANLCVDGKPSHKYFKDQSNLSADGLTQISINLKEAVYTALKDDYYIKTKLAQGVL